MPRHEIYKISKATMKNKINLFAEKPISLSKKSAEELYEISKKNKLIYTIGHMKRFDESIKYLKKGLFKTKDFKLNSLQSVYYESFAGDSFGKLKKFIKRNKRYKSHFINFDVLKIKSQKNIINFLKFLNTHSHAINLLRYLFGEINLVFNNLNKFGNRIIGFQIRDKYLS